MRAHYDPLPQSSSSSDAYGGEFKGRLPRSYAFALWRKTRRVCRPLYILTALVALLLLQVTYNSSYSSPPPFDVSPDETVYIAANIVDAALIDGPWGASLLQLVDLIGSDRVYVSIYGGPANSLKRLEARLPCENTVVSEEADPIDLATIPHIQLPTGESRIKRVAYLAEVRNRALQPLDSLARRYDRVLFLNDVFFEAKDAARLLWGTNVDERTGKAEYKAACGTDFVSSWKYYDTFATRDDEGYSIGVPIFPWFAHEGQAQSRRDVLDERSAVRVKSCWGGMVAFDGRYFQRGANAPRDTSPAEADPVQLPLRFRAIPEPFWSASECCLVHADLMADTSLPAPSWGSGIYMNPYVRVSYDATTHSRLWLVKRFERLAALPQRIISYYAGMPRLNTRRTEVEGQVYADRQWVSNAGPEGGAVPPAGRGVAGSQGRDFWNTEGHYVDYDRMAERGGYCDVRQLLVLKEGPWENGNWENLAAKLPPLESEL
jgi:hypothetical protein